MRHLRGELTAWWYTVWPSIQTVGLYKTAEQTTIRPLGIRNPLLKALHREVINSSREELLSFLEPQQLGMSLGGASKLVHSIRMLLEANPTFVCATNDCRNAFNENTRAAAVTTLQQEPSLAHLAHYAATSFIPSYGMESRGELWGRAEEGQTQGSPEAGPLFAVTIQEQLVELDTTVAAEGGMARAGWDNVYVVGPPNVVFPSLQRFWERLGEECGLERQLTKCSVYTSSGTKPAVMPDTLPLAGATVAGVFEPGFICYGIPIGSDNFVAFQLDNKVKEVVERAVKAVKLLEGESQVLWTILRVSIRHQFEYWLDLCYPSDVLQAAQKIDTLLHEVLEAVAGQHIPLREEGLGVEECLNIPVTGLTDRSFQAWLCSLPVRQGGMGMASQAELVPAAFIGALEQALPFFGGERGVCPGLAHLVGEGGDARYQPLVASNSRTGRELTACWEGMVKEVEEGLTYLGRELEDGPFSMAVAGVGEGSTTGAMRKTITRAREELRLEVFEQAIALHPNQQGRGVSSWKERDKLTTAFLLSIPGPNSSLSSPIFAEALATLLCLPSRVCADRLGERVGGSRVDLHGERVILENLPGGHWTDRHNAMEREVAALCSYAGLPAEREPFGLFGHLLPQQALNNIQQHKRSQVLQPDLRLDVLAITVCPTNTRTPPGRGTPAAPPAPLTHDFSGSNIAEIKVLGKGVKKHYKSGTRGTRAVEQRAAEIPAEYRRKAVAMDTIITGMEGVGPCQRRLDELPLLRLVWGTYGEASTDVHTLVTLLATCRVRTLALRGEQPSAQQMGLEVTAIRRRLSTAAIRAANTVLLARLSQVGEGSGLASRRRSRRAMSHGKEADWQVHTTGRELVRRGRFWGK